MVASLSKNRWMSHFYPSRAESWQGARFKGYKKQHNSRTGILQPTHRSRMQCPEEGMPFSVTVSTSTRAELPAHRKSRWSCPVERWGALHLSLCSYELYPSFPNAAQCLRQSSVIHLHDFTWQLVTPHAKNLRSACCCSYCHWLALQVSFLST